MSLQCQGLRLDLYNGASGGVGRAMAKEVRAPAVHKGGLRSRMKLYYCYNQVIKLSCNNVYKTVWLVLLQRGLADPVRVYFNGWWFSSC